jgi:hypothetical protein
MALLNAQPRKYTNVKTCDECDVLFTDASLSGWGAVCFGSDGKVTAAGGEWSSAESSAIIAELEAKALRRGLETLVVDTTRPIMVFIDNTTLQHCWFRRRSRHFYINKMLLHLEQWNIVRMDYIESKLNIADGISRGEAIDATLRRVSWIGEVRKENLSNSSCASSTQTEEHISDWNLLMQTI